MTGGIDVGRRVIRHRGVSDGSDGSCPLRRSHLARTEMFFADFADALGGRDRASLEMHLEGEIK